MKRATISQTKNQLSALLELVKRGEEILVLDRDVPVARIVPVDAASTPDEERLLELERRGVIVRSSKGPHKRLPPPVEVTAGAGILDALLRDRDEARF